MSIHLPPRNKPEKALSWLFLVICCVLFPVVHFFSGTIYRFATPVDLLNGTAAKPFQYRTLIPSLTSTTMHIAMGKIDPAVGVLFMIGFEAMALFGLALVLQALGRTRIPEEPDPSAPIISPPPPAITGLLFIGLSALLVDPFGQAMWYPSDIPGVFFIAISLLALRHRSWPLFFLFYGLGCLNRETILLVTFAHAASAAQRKELRTNLPLIACQVVLWSSVKALLWAKYLGNPGEPMAELHLLDNLGLLFSPHTWLRLAAGPGFLWLPLLFAFGRIPDGFSKQVLSAALPFVTILLVVGNLLEVRIYADLVALAMPCCISLYSSPSAPFSTGGETDQG